VFTVQIFDIYDGGGNVIGQRYSQDEACVSLLAEDGEGEVFVNPPSSSSSSSSSFLFLFRCQVFSPAKEVRCDGLRG
jgi:hypothetical protein